MICWGFRIGVRNDELFVSVRCSGESPLQPRCIASLFHREGKISASDSNLRVASPSGAGGERWQEAKKK